MLWRCDGGSKCRVTATGEAEVGASATSASACQVRFRSVNDLFMTLFAMLTSRLSTRASQDVVKKMLLAGDGFFVRQRVLIYAWVARALLLSSVTDGVPVVCGHESEACVHF